MINLIFVLFAIAAIGGATMVFIRLKKGINPPKAFALGHWSTCGGGAFAPC